MKRFPVRRDHLRASAVYGMLLLALGAQSGEVAVSRYTAVSSAPSALQRDPLAAPVVSMLPASVRTVGAAIEQLLAPSGYRLSMPLAVDPERSALFALPLPEVHRALGALPLRTALQVLAGPAFILVEDPVRRLVSFERCTHSAEGS